MIILRPRKREQMAESHRLDEMAIQAVSSRSDGLPFRITVKSPDHMPPHAHVMDLATGKKEQGQFKIPGRLPRVPGDIEDYKQGITEEMREIIFEWMNQRNLNFPEDTNWRMLCKIWSPNEKW
jgi:hypothetical protein